MSSCSADHPSGGGGGSAAAVVATVRPTKFRSPYHHKSAATYAGDSGLSSGGDRSSKASSEEREDVAAVTAAAAPTFLTHGDYELRLVKKASRVRERIKLLEDKYGKSTTTDGKKKKSDRGGGGAGGDGGSSSSANSGGTQIVLDPIDPSRSASLAELGRLISDTGDLLSRNSRLRASLTISMRKKGAGGGGGGGGDCCTIAIPATPRQGRKRLSLKRGEGMAAAAAGAGAQQGDEESRKTSSRQVSNNMRRRPSTGLRRTASKKKPLTMTRLSTATTATKLPDSELRALRRSAAASGVGGAGDISRIVRALNKLDEEAAKDTAVLRRSLRLRALEKARSSRSGNDIHDNCKITSCTSIYLSIICQKKCWKKDLDFKTSGCPWQLPFAD